MKIQHHQQALLLKTLEGADQVLITLSMMTDKPESYWYNVIRFCNGQTEILCIVFPQAGLTPVMNVTHMIEGIQTISQIVGYILSISGSFLVARIRPRITLPCQLY